uniref:Uncharacterized protein n=1 Tax=viral metagenome TaxID=1070528 RepID=A0A6C0KPV2_9ZZZZ
MSNYDYDDFTISTIDSSSIDLDIPIIDSFSSTIGLKAIAYKRNRIFKELELELELEKEFSSQSNIIDSKQEIIQTSIDYPNTVTYIQIGFICFILFL